jgi:hypothetical protein
MFHSPEFGQAQGLTRRRNELRKYSESVILFSLGVFPIYEHGNQSKE